MEANKENHYAYNSKLQPFANKLRHRMTKAEACLWKYALRAGIRKGYGFRRQRPVLNFIVDFMCKELMLIIEVDGVSHTWEETIKKDKIREERMKKAGVHILRFEDESVLRHMNWVIEEIDLKIEEIERASTTLPLMRQKRGTLPQPPQEGDRFQTQS